MNWLDQILSRRHRNNEIAESIQEHLEEKIEDLMEGGFRERRPPTQPAENSAILH